MKIYLETCFFITLLEKRSNGNHQNWEVNEKIFNLVQDEKIEAITSFYTQSELLNRLKAVYRKQRNPPSGEITSEILQHLAKTVTQLLAVPGLRIANGDNRSFENSFGIVANSCVTAKDSLHVFIASEYEVDYLVTEDRALHARGNSIVKTAYPDELLLALN